MAGYIERVVDSELDELLEELPAVALEGPRAVGKTETALRRAQTVFRLDNDSALAIARADPQRLAKGEQPILSLETLRSIVHQLGGEIEIAAVFEDRRVLIDT